MNIKEAKADGERQAKKLGHELKLWDKPQYGGHRRFCYCKLCNHYVCISKDKEGFLSIWGTAIEERPVRSNTDGSIGYILERCRGIEWRAVARRKYTRREKQLQEAFDIGIDEIIRITIGEYPK